MGMGVYAERRHERCRSQAQLTARCGSSEIDVQGLVRRASFVGIGCGQW
jgi:hypothetical protein